MVTRFFLSRVFWFYVNQVKIASCKQKQEIKTHVYESNNFNSSRFNMYKNSCAV
jgi:hypothetical protein